MARIFLTHPYLLKNDVHQSKLKQPYPPLGTLQAAALLERSGHEVIWHDPTFDTDLSELKALIRLSDAAVLAIVPDDHSVQIKQCTAPVRQVMLELIQYAHELSIQTVVSGPDASDNPSIFSMRVVPLSFPVSLSLPCASGYRRHRRRKLKAFGVL